MLNYTEIASKIKDPLSLTLEDAYSLEHLDKRYPYSPVFSMLILKGLSMHNTIRFEEELERLAYRIPDRTQLYNLIYSAETLSVASSEASSEEQGVSLLSDQPIEQKVETLEEEPVIEESKIDSPVIEIEESIVREELTEEEIKEDYQEKPEEVETTIQDEIEEERRRAEKDRLNKISQLEKDILAHAISASISLEIEDESSSFEQIQFSDLRALDLDSEDKKVEVPVYEESKVEKSETDSEKTFIDWLNSPTTSVSVSNLTLEKEEKEQNKTEIEEKNEENISRNKIKSDFYSIEQKVAESMDESRLPVSETLAKVYELQGNYPKAIDAYQKLILKIPEKKSFFATQIEILKNKLK